MNVADMTCLEVNEALAKRRGESEPMTLYRTKDDGSLEILQQGYAPDYCHNWKWAGKVLEDMLIPQVYLELGKPRRWRCEPCWDMHFRDPETGNWLPRPGASAPTPTEAIARAGLQMCLDEEGD